MNDQETLSFNIFISHRHQDERIARAVHDVLRDVWLRGENRQIFLSSLPGKGRPGADLNEYLTDALKITDLFILIFTQPDEDWSYCMWELGVVTGADTKDTQVVVLNCAKAEPRVRVANLSVNARSEASIMNFAQPFFTEPEWLIKHEPTRTAETELITVLGEIGEEGITRRSKALHQELEKVVPKVKPQWMERLQHIEFTVEPSDVHEIRELIKEADDDLTNDNAKRIEFRAEAHAMLQMKMMINEDAKQSALNRFGFEQHTDNMNLESLINNWEKYYKTNHKRCPTDEDRAWISDLLDDLERATTGELSSPTNNSMPSIHVGDNTRVIPTIVRTRQRDDEGIDFSLYFFKVPSVDGVQENADLVDDQTLQQDDL